MTIYQYHYYHSLLLLILSLLHINPSLTYCGGNSSSSPSLFSLEYCPTFPSNGEWNTSSKLSQYIQTIPCTIERIHKLTPEQFSTIYDDRQPFVFVTSSPSPSSVSFSNRCRKDNLLQHFGEANVVLSSANSFSYEKRVVKMRHYIETMMEPLERDKVDGDKIFYLFGYGNDELEELLKEYPIPFPNYTPIAPSLSWGMAGDGTGVPFHTHGPVFAEVIFGRKLWLLYPQGEKPYNFQPNKTSLYWIETEYFKNFNHLENTNSENLTTDYGKPIACILNPGEILYIPKDWFHSTLNLGQTIFISSFV